MYSQAQSGTQTEQKNAMTDSVYKIKEVVVRSNQMLGSKFEARNRTGSAYTTPRTMRNFINLQ